MNLVMLIGNLSRDPETRVTPSGKSMCNFSIAVGRKFKDRSGEKITDFFDIVAFGQLADNCAKYLSKGKKVSIVGELQNSKYEKNGETRYKTGVVANEVEFLTPRGNSAQQNVELDGFVDTDEPLPF